MRCSYCAYPLIEGRRGRQRAPADVVDEIERVLRATEVEGRTRPRTFEFVDSTFNIPSAHAVAICEEVIRRGVRTNFTAMGLNPRDVPPELLPLMKRAGFNSVMITPEAGCAAMLENYRKGFTLADVEATLERVRASGLTSMWFFMLGAPGETMATCAETIGFARDRLVGRRFLSVFFTGIRILPATEVASQALASGYLRAGADLAEARFFASPAIDEQQVIDLIDTAIVRIRASSMRREGGATNTQRPSTARCTPWRRAAVLAVPSGNAELPPLHFLRRRHPAVSGGASSPDATATGRLDSVGRRGSRVPGRDHPIAAALLRPVERRIGPAEQGFAVLIALQLGHPKLEVTAPSLAR
jgi:hypothetical protein